MRLKSLLLTAVGSVVLSAGFAQAQEGDPVRGERKAATCMGCHAIEGARNAYPSYRVPLIGGQNEAYLYNALKAYKDGSRTHSTMMGQAQTLSDEDMRDIAAYFSRQEQ